MGVLYKIKHITVVTECGAKPRLLEVAADGVTIVADIPIQPETDNSHMQSRMGRKTASGTYLIPHRQNFVKEYAATSSSAAAASSVAGRCPAPPPHASGIRRHRT